SIDNMLGVVEDTSSKDVGVKERNESPEEEIEDEEFEEEEEEEARVGYKPRISIHMPTLPPLPENYPLHAAVIRKDSQALVSAIKALPPCTDPSVPLRSRPINALDHHGYTALTLSVLTSWMEGVKILLEYGASPSVTSLEGWTSIQEAVSTSQREILRMLVIANMKIMKEDLAARASIIREQLKQVSK
ncbi:Ankyrin repeat domain-containing protein, partial [Reticulomyxa filosa]